MKTIKHISFGILLVVATILSSCSSDGGSGGGGGTGSVGTFKAKIGSTNFTSIPQAANAILATNGTFQNLSMSGADATGKSLILTIIGENIGVGTYALQDQGTPIVSGTYTEANLSNPAASIVFGAPYDGGGNSGSIIITAKTATNVQGTFSFTAINATTGSGTKAITNGVFNLNITSN